MDGHCVPLQPPHHLRGGRLYSHGARRGVRHIRDDPIPVRVHRRLLPPAAMRRRGVSYGARAGRLRRVLHRDQVRGAIVGRAVPVLWRVIIRVRLCDGVVSVRLYDADGHQHGLAEARDVFGGSDARQVRVRGGVAIRVSQGAGDHRRAHHSVRHGVRYRVRLVRPRLLHVLLLAGGRGDNVRSSNRVLGRVLSRGPRRTHLHQGGELCVPSLEFGELGGDH
mmetsp:Transcript_35600/g.80982  ORF Transcript_35600/g.80982 Transcript_35600/m.80982 type:complete len:222 (+) Transcript_35600:345-1010(+)